MNRWIGVFRLALLCVVTAVGCLMVSSAQAKDTASIEVYSDAVTLDGAVRPDVDALAASDFVTRLESESSVRAEDEGHSVAQIAEPGTLGLMALAGLMGGAIAMRHRLG